MLEGWRQGAWCNNISFARFKIVNNQNIIASDNYLFVYKILDLAKLMLLNSIVKLNYVTQKDFLVMIPASTLIKNLFFYFSRTSVTKIANQSLLYYKDKFTNLFNSRPGSFYLVSWIWFMHLSSFRGEFSSSICVHPN